MENTNKLMIACGMVLTITNALVYGDRGRGSIRAAEPSRQMQTRQEPVREAVRETPRGPAHEPARVQVEEKHVDEHLDAPHSVPHVEVQTHRDWDDNDEDGRNFGGFARGVPVHINRGERIRTLPSRNIRLHFGNIDFFLGDNGAYYQPQSDGEYIIVQPPVGIVVSTLPDGAIPIMLGPTAYYDLDGIYYIAQNNTFAVVNPPVGLVVPALPSAAAQVVINGNVNYQFNGFNYQPSMQDGVTVYTVEPV